MLRIILAITFPIICEHDEVLHDTCQLSCICTFAVNVSSYIHHLLSPVLLAHNQAFSHYVQMMLGSLQLKADLPVN
jgi:hypothetical protein